MASLALREPPPSVMPGGNCPPASLCYTRLLGIRSPSSLDQSPEERAGLSPGERLPVSAGKAALEGPWG